jgi:hypothetical protein
VTHDDLLRALVVERFATVTPPPPQRPARTDEVEWDPDDYDPDADADLHEDAGEWLGTRRVETVEIPGVSR